MTTKCNACLAIVDADLIAGRKYNTGGDTICLACHAECCPEDRGDVVQEVCEWVNTHDDDSVDAASAEVAFRACLERFPDDEDRAEGIWSHLCQFAA